MESIARTDPVPAERVVVALEQLAIGFRASDSGSTSGGLIDESTLRLALVVLDGGASPDFLQPLAERLVRIFKVRWTFDRVHAGKLVEQIENLEDDEWRTHVRVLAWAVANAGFGSRHVGLRRAIDLLEAADSADRSAAAALGRRTLDEIGGASGHRRAG